jgi:hypothetical protein
VRGVIHQKLRLELIQHAGYLNLVTKFSTEYGHDYLVMGLLYHCAIENYFFVDLVGFKF